VRTKFNLNNNNIMDSKNLIGGLLAGAAVGVAIGLLLAPTSGKETRRKLADGSRKLTDSVKGSVEDSIETLKERFNAGFDEVAKKGKETYNVAKDGIKV
jgi:gas vesicle protein